MHVVSLFDSPVKSGDMGASKQFLSDLKTKIFKLCEISAVSFHGEERCEGHSQSSWFRPDVAGHEKYWRGEGW